MDTIQKEKLEKEFVEFLGVTHEKLGKKFNEKTLKMALEFTEVTNTGVEIRIPDIIKDLENDESLTPRQRLYISFLKFPLTSLPSCRKLKKCFRE